MITPVISATGLWTPSQSVSNAELVESYNAWADKWNAEHAADIASGTVEAKTHSSVEFIEKASGIKSRFVVDKAGVIDPDIMRPNIPERPNEEISILAEIAVKAARQALERAGRDPQDVDAVLCAASNMQRGYPAMAVEIQDALGIDGFGFDHIEREQSPQGLSLVYQVIDRRGSRRSTALITKATQPLQARFDAVTKAA